jgi:hypothetical protein
MKATQIPQLVTSLSWRASRADDRSARHNEDNIHERAA